MGIVRFDQRSYWVEPVLSRILVGLNTSEWSEFKLDLVYSKSNKFNLDKYLLRESMSITKLHYNKLLEEDYLYK